MVLLLASCSAGGERLAADCAKISALVNKPVTRDFDEAAFAAQVRALRPGVDDERLVKQLGIVADHWGREARARGPIKDLQKDAEESDRAIAANDELTRICEKTGRWTADRPTSPSSSG
ncbi:hypothetical protein [Actinomadura harenae]|uniref:hypothetical protein n=1 Tax=Actinomadura harenae TaxID=2483351 RepID=UPI0013153404|nr:hypothetical protein [Actinomadura harenae]